MSLLPPDQLPTAPVFYLQLPGGVMVPISVPDLRARIGPVAFDDAVAALVRETIAATIVPSPDALERSVPTVADVIGVGA